MVQTSGKQFLESNRGDPTEEKKPCPGVAGFACDACLECGSPLHEHPEVQRVVSDGIITKRRAALEAGTVEYKDDIPLGSRPRGVWQVNFEGGDKWVVVMKPDMEVEQIIEALKNRYPGTKFKVGQIDTGAFKLAEPYVTEKEPIFRSDSRWITQDGLVEL